MKKFEYYKRRLVGVLLNQTQFFIEESSKYTKFYLAYLLENKPKSSKSTRD